MPPARLSFLDGLSVHQVIDLTLVAHALGVRLHSWLAYWVADLALVVACVYLGRGWPAIKRIVRERATG